MRRVFITGMGVISSVGNDRETFWQSLLAGRSGIRPWARVDATNLPVTFGGEVRDLDIKKADVNDKVDARRKMDLASIFAVCAAREALAHAGLPEADLGPRVAVVLGSGLAGLQTLQEQTERLLTKGPDRVSPFTIPVLMPNAAPANVSLAFGTQGSAYTVASACSSSGHAMIDAFELIRRGEADTVLTGGTESPLTRLAISAFANMKAMTKSHADAPHRASRPFDSGRDGFVMSEGSAVLIFEAEDTMKARGAKPMAEMVGYGQTMDSHHLVQPDVSAKMAIHAMRQALAMAGWDPAAIASDLYINAHGTSTKFNDQMETNAVKAIFGHWAKDIRMSSTKSTTGHMIGAAGAVEMVACTLAMRDNLLPPTINYETPDPECDLDYIPNQPRSAEVSHCLNNTFGFGGHNVCLAIRRVS